MEVSVPERLLSDEEQTQVLDQAERELEAWLAGQDLEDVERCV